MPLQVLMAFEPMQIKGLGVGSFDPLLSTADIPGLLSGSGMVSLNVLILIAILCPGICLVGQGWLIQDWRQYDARKKAGKDFFNDGGVGLLIHSAFPNTEGSDSFS